MVATRRGTVIQLPDESEVAGTQQISAELTTPAPQRQAIGIKAEPSHVNESEPFNFRSKRTTRNSSRKGVPSDGDVSEAESTCSSLSGLQTPTIPRTTRSRQNASSSQADSVQKNRNKKSVMTSLTISESHEEADVSEAESNCSSVVEVQRTISRRMRSRPRISKRPKACRTEEVSDSESCSSTVSAGHLNRVTRSRISKLQRGVHQFQDSNKESVLQCLTKNKADNVSEAESWCSGISAGRTVGRLTRNSLARSQTVAESQPIVLSDLGIVEKLVSDAEQESVGSSRVSRSLRNRPSSQTNSESVSKSQAESQSDELQHCINTTKVTERMSTRATASKNQTPVCDQGKARSPDELLSEAFEVEKDKCTIQNEMEEVITPQPDNKNLKKSPMKQKTSPRKGIKTVLEPQQMVEEITIDDDDEDDCEITEVIAAVDSTTCAASIVGTSSSPTKRNVGHITELRKDIGSVLFLTSDTEIEVSDASSEDEDVCTVDNNEKKVPSKESVLSGNDLFIIDKSPGLSTSKKYYIEKQKTHVVENKGVALEEVESIHDETDDDDFIDEDENDALLQRPKSGLTLSTTIDPGLNIKDLGGLYIDLEAGQQIRKPSTLKAKEIKKNDEILKHSIITPDFEKKDSVPPYSESMKQLKKKRRTERDKTTGDGWFGMKAPELTDELKNDLKALKMRSAIDPKRFYKKNDRDGFPKYFQVGTVVDNAVDFYRSRVPKSQRKRTIVEELLADSEFRKYNKKKYQEIMTEKMAFNAGKKNRKKKKFRT